MGLWVIFTIDIRLCKFRIQIKYDDLYCVFVCFRHRVGLTGEIGILFIGPVSCWACSQGFIPETYAFLGLFLRSFPPVLFQDVVTTDNYQLYCLAFKSWPREIVRLSLAKAALYLARNPMLALICLNEAIPMSLCPWWIQLSRALNKLY